MSAKKRQTTRSLPLQGVTCCVDARNEDGSDASDAHAKLLKELGATVESGGIKMGLTHMIWARGNLKHVKAAEFMDITVVSPLWVEQCREAQSRVSESDFLVDADGLTAPPPPCMEPKVNHASLIASPSFNSSQVEAVPIKARGRKPAVPKKLPAAATNIVPFADSVSVTTNTAAKPLVANKHRRKPMLTDSSSDSDSDVFNTSHERSSKASSTTAVSSSAAVATTAKSSTTKNSKSNPSPSTITLSLTSFLSDDRALLCDIVTALQSSSASTIQLVDDEDYSLAALTKCSVLVAPKKRANRTVRVLFAMASGVPIVTEDFIHSSLEDGDCSLHCVGDHLHPRFKMRVGAPKQLLDRCVFLGPCVDPPHNVVADLVKVLGAKNVVKTVSEADAVIIEGGNTGAAQRMKSFRLNLSPADLKHFDSLSISSNVVTTKTLFDAIEFGIPLKSKSVATPSSGTKTKSPKPTPNSTAAAPAKQRQASATKKSVSSVTNNKVASNGSVLASSSKSTKRAVVVSDSDDDFGSPTPPSKKARHIISTRLPRAASMAPSPIVPLSKSHILSDDSEGEADLSYVINVPQQDGSPSW